MKILCLDFDGVIHSYKTKWKGATYIPDPPVNGAFAFIEEAIKHFRVAIYSARSKNISGISAMRSWFLLHTHGTRHEAWVNKLEWPMEKPPAFVTIDDRAITFDGTFPPVDYLLGFETWQQRGQIDIFDKTVERKAILEAFNRLPGCDIHASDYHQKCEECRSILRIRQYLENNDA